VWPERPAWAARPGRGGRRRDPEGEHVEVGEVADEPAVHELGDDGLAQVLDIHRPARSEIAQPLFVLNAFGIRHVGKHVARLLSRHFRSLERVAGASVEGLDEVHGVGPQIAESVSGNGEARRRHDAACSLARVSPLDTTPSRPSSLADTKRHRP
jgi:hypothetical protein